MNINAISLVLLLTTFQAVATEASAADQKSAVARTKQQIMADSRRDRFGIFIHWDPSSLLELGGGSWNRAGSPKSPQENQTKAEAPAEITSGEYLKYKGQGAVPQIVYDNLFHAFNPTNFNAVEWVKLFKEAGAGYIVFTSKHHDGFCMFDTKTQDYDIMHSPFGRDICKELADACRAGGIRLFFYYSPVDWWNPGWISNQDTAYEDDYFLPQVKELLTNYGSIDGIWWDGCQITKNYTQKTRELIQQTQPWILTNGRLGGGDPGDFNTPEQTLGEFNLKEPWESCVTMAGDAWFWNGGKDYKSTNTCLGMLIQCACGDGNLLLDAGPRPDGRFDDRAASTYRAMGRWLSEYGQTIRGTRGGPYKPGAWGGSTRQGNHIYLHIMQSLESGILNLPALPVKVLKARCLTGGKATYKQSATSLTINLSKQASPDTVVELTVDGDSMSISPIELDKASQHSLTENAAGSSSSISGWMHNNASCIVPHSWETGGASLHFGEPGYDEQQAALANKPKPEGGFGWGTLKMGHPYRFWQAAPGDTSPWVELELASAKTFSQVSLLEHYEYTQAFAFDAWVAGQWKTIFSDNEMGCYSRKLKTPVTTTKVRIRFLKYSSQPTLSGVMLYQ